MNTSVPKNPDIVLYSRMGVHVVVHGRADNHWRPGSQEDRGKQIVGDARRHLPDDIGGGRRYYDHIPISRQRDMVQIVMHLGE